MTGGCGWVELGSPLIEVANAFEQGLWQRELLYWGGAAFRILDIAPVKPPTFASGAGTVSDGYTGGVEGGREGRIGGVDDEAGVAAAG